MATMIAENSYLIPEKIKEDYAQLNKYIIVVTDLESEKEGGSDETLDKLENIKRHLLKNIEKMNKVFK
jgi:hypothetical protein